MVFTLDTSLHEQLAPLAWLVGRWQGAGLVGFLCAAVSHATRRMLSVLPAVTSVRGQLSTAAASLLVPGVVAYGLALAIVG